MAVSYTHLDVYKRQVVGFQDSVENVANCPFKKGGNVMRWYFVEVEKQHEEDVLESVSYTHLSI